MLHTAEQKNPLRENISSEDVGTFGTYVCSPAGRHITGTVLHVDSGAHIMGA